MNALRRAVREHLHFIVVTTVLTLVMTFPTIVYVFRTDVFWHPAGSSFDVFIHIWDVWYGSKLAAGQADLYHTNVIFYPEGVSLTYHPFIIPHMIVANALAIFMPLSNAYSVTYLLIISSSAFSAYIYGLWLFKDKWIALIGAIVFGFSPNVLGHPNQPEDAIVATIPLALYCLHRGIQDRRRALVILAGVLTGLTTVISMYPYTCLLITLGLAICSFTLQRWRDRRFWQDIVLVILVIAASSFWRVYHLTQDRDALDAALEWHGDHEDGSDLVSYFVRHHEPMSKQLFETILHTPEQAQISRTSFLGYLPILLICVGLVNKTIRRKMLPWAGLCAVFLVLRLGSHLNVNGIAFTNILLPKFYLDQMLPFVFQAFVGVDRFMIGAILPLAILTCFGLTALQERFSFASRRKIILAIAVVIAIEYYIPTPDGPIFPIGNGSISSEGLEFLDWLAQVEQEEIRLINLPMGRANAKLYSLFQSLSGYPHAEGALSRTPDSAFDYIRSNFVLNGWYNQRAVTCGDENRNAYLTALDRLEDDGFSHVVFYRNFYFWTEISDSFRVARPSYRDDYVSIYRMSDLRESCQ